MNAKTGAMIGGLFGVPLAAALGLDVPEAVCFAGGCLAVWAMGFLDK